MSVEISPVDEIRLEILKTRRDEMIRDLIDRKKFNPTAAVLAVDNFLKTMKFVLDSTGTLP